MSHDDTQPPPFNVHNARMTSASPASLIERRVIVEQVTLRDQFAMAALTGLLMQGAYKDTPNVWSTKAYTYADAMLKARGTKQ